MDSSEYYHVTTKEKLPGIMTKGLIPQMGRNSEWAGEESPALFLTDRQSLPYWCILTNGDTVLKIDKNAIPKNAKTYNYTNYDEIIIHDAIDTGYIKTATFPTKEQLTIAMHYLAAGYIRVISSMCYSAIRTEWELLDKDITHEERKSLTEDAKTIAAEITGIIKIMENINFEILTPEEMADIVTKHSNNDCFITFADTYFDKSRKDEIPDAGKRCWQHLANIQINEMRTACLELHKFIKKVIPARIRRLPDIGGFCM